MSISFLIKDHVRPSTAHKHFFRFISVKWLSESETWCCLATWAPFLRNRHPNAHPGATQLNSKAKWRICHSKWTRNVAELNIIARTKSEDESSNREHLILIWTCASERGWKRGIQRREKLLKSNFNYSPYSLKQNNVAFHYFDEIPSSPNFVNLFFQFCVARNKVSARRDARTQMPRTEIKTRITSSKSILYLFFFCAISYSPLISMFYAMGRLCVGSASETEQHNGRVTPPMLLTKRRQQEATEDSGMQKTMLKNSFPQKI